MRIFAIIIYRILLEYITKIQDKRCMMQGASYFSYNNVKLKWFIILKFLKKNSSIFEIVQEWE